MAASVVKVQDGFIDLGICKVPVSAFTDIEINSPNDAASGKTIKVADARVKALCEVLQHGAMANYTIALTITREPVTDEEATAIGVKSTAQETRKAEEARKLQAATDRTVKYVQDAERAAADRQAERDAAVLENTIKVLSRNRD